MMRISLLLIIVAQAVTSPAAQKPGNNSATRVPRIANGIVAFLKTNAEGIQGVEGRRRE